MGNKIALVTGGSSGLGYAIARKYRSAGRNICIVSRNEERLKHAALELKETKAAGEVLNISANVALEQDVSRVFTEISNRGYELEDVYNVAGIGLYGQPDAVSAEVIEKLLAANFIGLILVSTYSLRAMRDSGGTIVNVMSSAAKKANPLETVYCGVKWGARGYTEALSAAMKGSNIRIVSVFPGGMNTPFWDSDTGLTPDTSKFMDPREVAETIYEALLVRTSMKVTEISLDRR